MICPKIPINHCNLDGPMEHFHLRSFLCVSVSQACPSPFWVNLFELNYQHCLCLVFKVLYKKHCLRPFWPKKLFGVEKHPKTSAIQKPHLPSQEWPAAFLPTRRSMSFSGDDVVFGFREKGCCGFVFCFFAACQPFFIHLLLPKRTSGDLLFSALLKF